MKYPLLALAFMILFLANIVMAEGGVYFAINNQWTIALYQWALSLWMAFTLRKLTIFDIYKLWRRSKIS